MDRDITQKHHIINNKNIKKQKESIKNLNNTQKKRVME